MRPVGRSAARLAGAGAGINGAAGAATGSYGTMPAQRCRTLRHTRFAEGLRGRTNEPRSGDHGRTTRPRRGCHTVGGRSSSSPPPPVAPQRLKAESRVSGYPVVTEVTLLRAVAAEWSGSRTSKSGTEHDRSGRCRTGQVNYSHLRLPKAPPSFTSCRCACP